MENSYELLFAEDLHRALKHCFINLNQMHLATSLLFSRSVTISITNAMKADIWYLVYDGKRKGFKCNCDLKIQSQIELWIWRVVTPLLYNRSPCAPLECILREICWIAL